MRIRWKFLILLLAISIIPILLMRSLAQRSMRELGNDLSTRARDELIRRASLELKSLVEEHAVILKRERDLVEMALQVQASELEKIFASGSAQNEKNASINMSESESDWTAGKRSPKHYGGMGRMKNKPLKVSYKEQTYRIPSTINEQAAARALSKISSLVPVYQSLERKHPDLIFWQLTALEKGIQTIYPAVQHVPMMYNSFNAEWYQLAKDINDIIWSKPGVDPITRQMVFTVSAPFFLPDGSVVGVTAIMVPVNVLLQEDKHIQKISKSTTSLLVRAQKSGKADKRGIRIIAQQHVQRQMHHHWQVSSQEEWLEIEDKQQYENLFMDLRGHKTDVQEITYQDQDSLAAYGCIDEYCTALLIVVPKKDIVAEAVAMESYVLARIGRQIKVTSIMLSVVILLVIGLALFFSRSITRNIYKLVAAVRNVTSGDFTTRVDIQSRDEIGELGQTLNRMVPELEERLAMKQALDVAMEVQQNLLPKKIPSVQGLDIAGRSIYCDETGGDFYDFLEIGSGSSNRIGIAVGDVSGHGISAALLMASVRAFFRSRVVQPGSVSEIVTDVNGLVTEDTDETGHFMTLFYTEIAPEEKILRWVRAGHDPALFFDADNDRFVELRGNGMALGVERQLRYEENSITGLSKGQILMIGTDGLWETQNEEGEMFGKERLKAIIRQYARSSAEKILDSIIKALNEFQQSVKQEDDVTFVVVKFED